MSQAKVFTARRLPWMFAGRLKPRLSTAADGGGGPTLTLSRLTSAFVASRSSKPTQVRPLPLAVTAIESVVSMRAGTVWYTTGPGGAPRRTGTKIGEEEPSCPSTSTEMGVMVMIVFGVAFA